MIIALDGNVFVGKTTLCNVFSKFKKGIVIKEHSEFVYKIKNKLPNHQDNFFEHSHYLKVDAIRMKYIKNKLIFLDRSFISLSAHVYALYKIGSNDFRLKHIHCLIKLFNINKLIIPDNYIFVTCKYSLAKERYIWNKNSTNNKKTPDIFINAKYYKAINEFNLLWQSNIKNGLIINTSKPLNKKDLSFVFENFNEGSLSNEEIILIIKKIYFSL